MPFFFKRRCFSISLAKLSSGLDLFKIAQEIEQAHGRFAASFLRIHCAKLLTDLVLQTALILSRLLQLLYRLHFRSICDTGKRSAAAAIKRTTWNATPSPSVISAPPSIWRRTAMKTLTFAVLNSYASQYPAVRSVKEIAVWTWIAGAILLVCVLAAVLSPNLNKVATDSPPGVEKLMVPPIGQPALLPSEIITDPNL
jgi:hypothetical protein